METEESAGKQISAFVYCLGEEAESVLASTNTTAEGWRDFNRIIAKFDAYFKVRKNVIYERAQFNRTNKKSGETAEKYIMALYELSEHCEYSKMTMVHNLHQGDLLTLLRATSPHYPAQAERAVQTVKQLLEIPSLHSCRTKQPHNPGAENYQPNA